MRPVRLQIGWPIQPDLGIKVIKTHKEQGQDSVRNMLYFLSAIFIWTIIAGATETSRDPVTGLESWQIETHGVQVA